MKQLTEKQAWLYIAREFAKKSKGQPSDVTITGSGLCSAVWSLSRPVRFSASPRDALITARQLRYMIRAICKAGVKLGVASPLENVLWPLDQPGSANRAALARKFARECKK